MPARAASTKTARTSGEGDFVAVELSSPYSANQLQPHPSHSDLHLDRDVDHYSVLNTSRTRLHPSHSNTTMYPPETGPSPTAVPLMSSGPATPMPVPTRNPSGQTDPIDHAERAGIPGLPYTHGHHSGSWDVLSGVKKFEHSYQEFDPRNASEAHLAFADGDVPKNGFAKFYHYLLNVSIVTRWIIFIIPVLGLLWIPGILSLTVFPNANIWGTRLIWWSIWFSICWGGWWAALAVSRIIPIIARSTLGVIAVASRRYIDWLQALHRYIALFVWILAVWVSWNPIIDNNQKGAGQKSINAVDLVGKLLFAFVVCAGILLFEKFAIQWIAAKFHERSYAERIADQKFAVKSLVTLYRNSTDTPGRSDTLSGGTHNRAASADPMRIFKKLRDGVRVAATTTTTVFGNVASEIIGSSVLQPNSPEAMVKTALESANKSRLLARRIFYSFAKPGAEYILEEDIARFFTTPDEAHSVFALFDRDGNGDASREELEMSCLDFHREQLSIENSMRDLDSAVGRLDNILMTVYTVVAILIIAVALEAQLLTVVTGAGTLILGLSWLIGGSLQEVLTSIIFLFIKHPFDVGDRVVINKETYTVKEIHLLSTVFLDSGSTLVQAPNSILNTFFIQNLRRSPQMSETFTFDVAYSTTFEDLEKLRDKMLAFVKDERRDFQPSFDVTVKDFPDQEKLTLTADIKYKSNWQQGALKAKRRNKWICALKTALGELQIFGPKGNPDAPPSTTRYTQVPWELIQAKDREDAVKKAQETPVHVPVGGWHLRDKNDSFADPADALYGEVSEVRMPNPRRGLSEEGLRHRPAVSPMPGSVAMPSAAVPRQPQESIEMTPRT
ncbi:hypothetical protein NP233_g1300 [Leucocoprinus birnbaumii]|uniref:EF-hand domain-containing protein n=1 Tax=Leucocoprinus birnbaumii TaxID=56174 RepID=A0AAD5W0K2_9AGAR|nr:hypothetical protein NP233_g1300 [Leucocoprinus birnbaumii]